MARDFNQNRNTNAKLGSGRVSGYGNHWSLVDELDGWNKVFVETPNLPINIKEYLEGNTTLSVYATPQNIDKLHQYAFAGFPNLVDLYLLKEEEIVELDDNFLGGVSCLQHIYVPSDLLGDSSTQDTYLGECSGKTFASLFTAIPSVLEWTITPSEIGSDTLTEQNFNAYISTLTDRIKNAVGQLNLNGFTNGVDFAWSYDFSNVFPSLEDIYVDNVKVDFSTWTIDGSGTLTSEIVSASIASIPNDRLSGVNKVVIDSGFTSAESKNLLDSALSTLTSCVEIEIMGNLYSKLFSSSQITTFITHCSTNGDNYPFIPTSNTTLTSVNYINMGGSSYKSMALLGGSSANYLQNMSRNYYFPKLGNIQFQYTFLYIQASALLKIFFGKKSMAFHTLSNTHNATLTGSKLYCPANGLTNYLGYTQFGTIAKIGIIDGNSIYTNKGFEYPKLSSELTIDTTNGHLMDNGVDLFDGYTATWYSDEDCTITIQPSDITSDMTVYVKLTAI